MRTLPCSQGGGDIMSRNLRHELRTSVMYAFKENQNKHEIRQVEREKIGVWSYGTKTDLLNKIDTFSNWCKKEKEITKLEKVDKDLITEFLTAKSNEGCTDRTVEAYRSAFRRVGVLNNLDWNVQKVVSCRSTSADRGADSVISREDYKTLLDYCRNNPSKSSVCVLLQREIGIRAGDMAYGVKIEDNTLKIKSKNGRICTRLITPQVRQIIDSNVFKSMIDERGRVHAPKDDSLNKYLRRVQDKLGLERHSFHDLRRFSAQEKYDFLRRNGVDRTQSLNMVGQWLNHGEKRAEMVLESYVGNAW